jgi:Rrf2 family protein
MKNYARGGISCAMAFYTARVEYALHTLLNLSIAPSERAPSARELAEFQRLPVMFVRKLLTQLEKAELVEGAEGVRGGWRLARDPASITVLDIAEAARGGDEPLFECREIRARCALWPDGKAPRPAVTGVCSIHAVMLAAESAMRRELGSHTLAHLNAQVETKSSAAWKRTVASWFADRYGGRVGSSPVEPAG